MNLWAPSCSEVSQPENDEVAFTTLSDLCTTLVLGEASSFLLIPDVVPRLFEAMESARSSGDLMVLSARALSLLLENFSETIKEIRKKDSAKLSSCFQTVCGLTVTDKPKARRTLTFSRLSSIDLIDEVLKCLSLGVKSDRFAPLLPSVAAQLNFCVAVQACDSMRISCNVLQHCMLLVRSSQVSLEANQQLLDQLIQGSLHLLTASNRDADWDELLKAVTWCIMTLQRRNPPSPNSMRGDNRHPGHKRGRGSDDTAERGAAAGSSCSPPSAFFHAHFCLMLKLFVAIGTSCGEPRLNLILACLDGVLSEALTKEVDCHLQAVEMLHSILYSRAKSTASFSNPFAKKANTGSIMEGPEGKSLPNRQWNLPPLTWCGLTVLSKLLGLLPSVKSEYIWAFQGEDDVYLLYNRQQRALLTAKYFSSEKSVHFKRGDRLVDLVTLIDTRSGFLHMRIASPVHFQPVPCLQTLKEKQLPSMDAGEALAVSLLSRYSTRSQLSELLRILSFGATPCAAIARLLHLYYVCCAPVDDCETSRAPFRELILTCTPDYLDALIKRLLGRDARWGPVLLQAGVADATAQLAKNENEEEVAKRASGKKLVSPMMQVLLETEGHANSPVLPPSIAGLVQGSLRNHKKSATNLMECCSSGGASREDIQPLLEAEPSPALLSALEVFLSKSLQTVSIEGVKEELIPRVVQAPQSVVYVCQKDEHSTVRCANGHQLIIFHGEGWSCDQCGRQTAYGSHACRLCNFDLCHKCYEQNAHSISVSCTATVGNAHQTWHSLQKREEKTLPRSSPSGDPSAIDVPMVSIDCGVLPMVALAHRHPHIHICSTVAPCPCRPMPPFALYNNGLLEEDTPVSLLLKAFGRHIVTAVGGPMMALYGALEAVGGDIALNGSAGVPLRLQEILLGLRDSLPCSVKKDICHFIAVDCFRFALKELDDAQIVFPGSVQGDIEMVGLATKAQVARGNLDSMIQTLFGVFAAHPPIRSKVEFSFIGEEGTGHGPTQEVYAELSRLCSEQSSLWYETDDGVHYACPSNKKVLGREFFTLGAACARGFVDEYLIEVNLLSPIWTFVRWGAANANKSDRNTVYWKLLEMVDAQLHHSYASLLRSSEEELAALCLEDDKGVPVTTKTAAAYVESLLSAHFSISVTNLQYFAMGVSTSIDLNSLWILSDEELSVVLCGQDETKSESSDAKLFTADELAEIVEAAHGYEAESPIISQLISVVGSSFSRLQQQYFLEFLTGIRRLPVNGIRGLTRKITVVKKEIDAKERVLPSCSTCFFYLKLPPYTSVDTMRERLLFAITEGRRNFSLS